jgi:hypothetical protein
MEWLCLGLWPAEALVTGCHGRIDVSDLGAWVGKKPSASWMHIADDANKPSTCGCPPMAFDVHTASPWVTHVHA